MYVQLTEKTGLEVPTEDKNEYLLRINYCIAKQKLNAEKLKKVCMDSLVFILRVPRDVVYHNPAPFYHLIDKIYEEKGANYLLAAIYEAQFDTIDWDHPQVGERYSLSNWSYLNEDLGDIRKYQYENKEIDRMIKVMEAHRKSTHFHE